MSTTRARSSSRKSGDPASVLAMLTGARLESARVCGARMYRSAQDPHGRRRCGRVHEVAASPSASQA
eukprot:1340837-Pleurochrysis_carterae.AAC.1